LRTQLGQEKNEGKRKKEKKKKKRKKRDLQGVGFRV
jgi:hypothetical protein